MASISPSPADSSSPNSTTSTTTPPPQPTPSGLSPPPPTEAPTQPNATADPPALSNTPLNNSSPPPAVPSTPPPVTLSPPPPVPVLSPPALPPPPTSPPASPPPPTSPPASPPPPTSPPASPPPTTPNSSSPPPQRPPPPPALSPPPPTTSNFSPPPPVVSPPPSEQPPPPTLSPPVAAPPPPKDVSPPPPSRSLSPPPPADSPLPLPSSTPPPPLANPPETSPPPPSDSQPTSPPPVGSPPVTTPPPSNGTQTAPPSNGTQTAPSPSPPASSSPETPLSPPQVNASSGPPPPLLTPTGNTTNSESAPPGKSGGLNTGTVVGIGVLLSIIFLGFVGYVWWSRKKKTKLTGYHAGHVMPSPFGSSPASDASHIKVYSSAPLVGSSSGSDFIYSPPESGTLGNSRSIFTFQDLLTATSGFSAQNLLGEGGFGCVYKGVLADGREVAVKQLKIGGSQGEREFAAEVETISRVHHRHLVSLVGYCISDHQRLLVYDFVPNDTLYYHLHGKDMPVMDWAIRVKVATGAARGISYLHEDCHPRIIHRDIKSSNILLDNNFDAQVSDFGLAKLALDFDTHVTTRVMGTFGYMAPEYASSGKLTEKSDVYSFGVVLLELITGRKPVDASQPLGDESLVEWARPLMGNALENREFEELLDARLEKNYVESEVLRMIEAAAACVRHSAAKRPRMSQVVRALDAIGYSTDLTNGVTPGQSEIYNSAEQSAEIRLFQRMAFGAQDYSSEIFRSSSWDT